MPRDTVDLVAKRQRLLLEANAIPRVAAEPPVTGGARARALLALGVLRVGHPGRVGTKRISLLPRRVRGRPSPQAVDNDMRAYEVMVILDPSIEERTVEGSLDKYLNVIRKDGGSVESVDVWGRRRLAYETWYYAHLYTYLAIALASLGGFLG